MFDQPLGIADTDLDLLLRGVAEVESQRRYNDRRQVLLAVALADALPGPTDDEVDVHRGRGGATWSLERREQLAPHVPHVSELAPSHLAFAAGTLVDSARWLMAEGLTLRHRLPRLWQLLLSDHVGGSGRPVGVWKLREVASLTMGAGVEAAGAIDRDLSLEMARDPLMSSARIRDAVRRARLRTEPDAVRAEEAGQRDSRGVWLRPDPDAPAVTTLVGRLDTPDARHLDATIDHLAARFAQLGDDRSRDHRRAAGLAALADPQQALELQRGDDPHDAGVHAEPSSGSRGLAHHAILHLHLTPADLTDPAGTEGTEGTGAGGPAGDGVLEEGAGTLTAQLVRHWLRGSGCQVRVRPVITRTVPTPVAAPGPGRPGGGADHAREPAVDGYEPTVAIRQAVLLSERSCVFPGCSISARSSQLDHIDPYVSPDLGGPPGQTRASNLAPLCVRHHRAKTHLGWAYERLPDGRYLWTSPSRITRTRHPRPRLWREPALL